MKWSTKVEAKQRVKDVPCPDGKYCPDGNTCCPLPSGGYGCCPYAQVNTFCHKYITNN
jgi:progranulin